ncbi:hypothetical protein AQJ30_20875 [Streptomyces longwoodensis]|uniref:SHOCT domain-containing protein n=1 Tax=Streptomyces longwoodensis TaxID=68231 RepID=A0A117QML0_9ACTN|nr:hypothetical protein AQJ30_20875 [Streptomyces longwoodensis]
MEPDRYGVAEYLVDEVRTALTLDRVPADPVDAYLLPGWGFRKDPLMALVAAAVQARLPHPAAAVRAEPAPLVAAGTATAPAPAPDDGDHDVLLRRLRELGELHRSGVLTDEEFTRAKRAVLDRM